MEIIKSKYSKKESEEFVEDLKKYCSTIAFETNSIKKPVRIYDGFFWAKTSSPPTSASAIVVFNKRENFFDTLSGKLSHFDDKLFKMNTYSITWKTNFYAGIKISELRDPYNGYVPFFERHGLLVNSIDEQYLRKFDEKLPRSSIDGFLKKYDIKVKYLLSDNTSEWR